MRPFHAGAPARSRPYDMTEMQPEAIKRRAIDRAIALGAGDVRVVAARADEESRRRMEAAFQRGDLSAWAYDADYARRATDPGELLRGARSVICVAVPYATPEPAGGRLRGRVSNYAWSPDYHRRLHSLLGDVAREIDEARGRSRHRRRLRHEAPRGARVRRRLGTGLDRQAYESHRTVARLVRFFGRDRHDGAASGGRSAAQGLRRVPSLR